MDTQREISSRNRQTGRSVSDMTHVYSGNATKTDNELSVPTRPCSSFVGMNRTYGEVRVIALKTGGSGGFSCATWGFARSVRGGTRIEGGRLHRRRLGCGVRHPLPPRFAKGAGGGRCTGQEALGAGDAVEGKRAPGPGGRFPGGLRLPGRGVSPPIRGGARRSGWRRGFGPGRWPLPVRERVADAHPDMGGADQGGAPGDQGRAGAPPDPGEGVRARRWKRTAPGGR